MMFSFMLQAVPSFHDALLTRTIAWKRSDFVMLISTGRSGEPIPLKLLITYSPIKHMSSKPTPKFGTSM